MSVEDSHVCQSYRLAESAIRRREFRGRNSQRGESRRRISAGKGEARVLQLLRSHGVLARKKTNPRATGPRPAVQYERQSVIPERRSDATESNRVGTARARG